MSENWGVGKLTALNSAMATVQVGYAVTGLFISPFLVDQLKFSHIQSTIIFMIGPIAGFFVQPLVGSLSDNSHFKMGRRRPFIIAGSLITCVAFIMCALAGTIVDNNIHIARGLGVAGFAFLNVGLNSILGPFRALVQEVLPAKDLDRGNAFASTVLGVIFAVLNFGFYALARDMFRDDPNPAASHDFRRFFLIMSYAAAVLCILFIFPVCMVAREKPAGDAIATRSTFSRLFGGIKAMPPAMRTLFWSFMFCWAGFFPYQVFVTSSNCLGLVDGSLAAGLTNVVSFGFSFCVAALSRKRAKGAWIVPQLLAAFAFAALTATGLTSLGKTAVYGAALVIGINQAAMNATPFSLVGKGIGSPVEMGLLCSVLNAAIVLGQFLSLAVQSAAFSLGRVYPNVKLLGTTEVPYAVCAIFSLIAFFMVLGINTKDVETSTAPKGLLSNEEVPENLEA